LCAKAIKVILAVNYNYKNVSSEKFHALFEKFFSTEKLSEHDLHDAVYLVKCFLRIPAVF